MYLSYKLNDWWEGVRKTLAPLGLCPCGAYTVVGDYHQVFDLVKETDPEASLRMFKPGPGADLWVFGPEDASEVVLIIRCDSQEVHKDLVELACKHAEQQMLDVIDGLFDLVLPRSAR